MSWVAVLTAAAGAGLDDAAIAQAEESLQATARRLGPEAAEVGLDRRPELAPLRAALPGIDVNAVPTEGRRKRLLIADMDSTIIPVECIDQVAEMAGVGAEVAAITERAMAGELEFEDSLRERVALARGMDADLLERIWAERIALNPGARALVRTMAAHGAHTALISGGFTWFSERVARAAGFAEHRANRLLIENGRLVGKVAEPVLGRAAKREAMVELTAGLGLSHADVLAVGDGANDLAMIEAAGLGVGYRPKPAVAERADAVITHADLTALLYLQGYGFDEIVRD